MVRAVTIVNLLACFLTRGLQHSDHRGRTNCGERREKSASGYKNVNEEFFSQRTLFVLPWPEEEFDPIVAGHRHPSACSRLECPVPGGIQ